MLRCRRQAPKPTVELTSLSAEKTIKIEAELPEPGLCCLAVTAETTSPAILNSESNVEVLDFECVVADEVTAFFDVTTH